MTTNGEWNEMKRLVLARMDGHDKNIEKLSTSVEKLNTKVAVLCDREDRDSEAAKYTAARWGSGVGALVSAVITGIAATFRN
jgi:outer membrane murein-binding lipoprotein Lpp